MSVRNRQPSGREEPLRGRRHGRDRQYIKGHLRQVWEVPPLLRIAPPLNRVLKIVMGRRSDISLIFVAGRSRPRFLVSRASKGRPLFNSPYGLLPMLPFSIPVWIRGVTRLCNRRYHSRNISRLVILLPELLHSPFSIWHPISVPC